MLLILTDSFDVHADIVIEKLKKENISFFRFNLDVESLKKTYITKCIQINLNVYGVGGHLLNCH